MRKSKFKGTDEKLNQKMKEVVPLFLADRMWLEDMKETVIREDYQQILEALFEAVEQGYIENIKCLRTLNDNIFFNHFVKELNTGRNEICDSNPISLSKKGTAFLN